jgi:hypothetical protein
MPLWVRYAFKTEQALGSLPMVIVTPVFGGVAAAAVAVKAPAREVVRNGVVVDQSSYLGVVGLAALGALIGILLAILLALLWNVWTYRHRTDPSWATKWDLGVSQLRDLTESAWRQKQTHIMPTVLLISADIPPLAPATALGPVSGTAQLPDGSLFPIPPSGMGIDNTGVWFHPIRLTGQPASPGRYEVRWYGRWRQHDYEIARSVHTQD